MNTKRQPIQPLEHDENGTLRFRGNAIVRYLLEFGPFDMNDLACVDFPDADREQFAQLIGYSLSGFSELSYASDDTYETAAKMSEGETEQQALIKVLEGKVRFARQKANALAVGLLSVAPEDLKTTT